MAPWMKLKANGNITWELNKRDVGLILDALGVLIRDINDHPSNDDATLILEAEGMSDELQDAWREMR